MKSRIDPFHRVIDDLGIISQQTGSWGSNPEEEETVRMLNDAIRRFAERHVDEAGIDAAAHIPESVLQAAADMGLFGLTIAPEYGGSGLSMKAACLAILSLSERDRSVGTSLGLHAGLGLQGLNHLGTDHLKRKYLPDLATGKRIACFSITESEAGSDIASLRTTARQEGDQLVINGSKAFVTNGGFASLATILARTPGLNGSLRGHSMMLVPLDSEGVSRDAEEHKLGLRGSSTCSLHFDNVRIPLDHILGTAGKGLDQLQHVLTWGRTLMAAGNIGLARRAYAMALEQVTNRRQFNRLIAEFGMVREKLADMAWRIYAAESLIRMVTHLEDREPGSIYWESSVAKVGCTETAWQVADDALQLHGGSGYIEETGVARLLRDCRIGRIFEGANELLRFHMASAAFTWRVESLIDADPLASRLNGPLQPLAQQFDRLRTQFGTCLLAEKKAHGLKVFQRQMAQRRIADAAAGLYTMLALLTRTHNEIQQKRLDEEKWIWTRLGVARLTQEIERNLAGVDSPTHELASLAALQACARLGFELDPGTR